MLKTFVQSDPLLQMFGLTLTTAWRTKKLLREAQTDDGAAPPDSPQRQSSFVFMKMHPFGPYFCNFQVLPHADLLQQSLIHQTALWTSGFYWKNRNN